MILSLLWRLFLPIACCSLLALYWPIPSIIPSAFAADVDEQQQNTSSRCSSLTGMDGVMRPPGRGTAEEADLRVLVPLIHTFPQFVDCSDPANVKGWCVEVFERALSLLPPPHGKRSFTLNYTCLPLSNVHPTGAHNTTYDYMIEMLNQEEYDVAVGDITIGAKRLSEADFTQPFMPSGIVILSKLGPFDDNHKPSSWLLFLAPFSVRTWCTIFGVSIMTGLVLAMVERRAHFQDRQVISLLEQFRELSGLVTKGLILLEREPIRSGIGRLLMVAWLFFALLLSQSYNAGLNSYMTTKQLSPTTLDINYLKTSTMRIGHWGGSVVKDYLIERFHILEKKLIAFNTLDHYKGNLTQGDIAVVDELPYVKLLLSSLSSPCDYVISNPPLTSEGFGLALRKNSSWTPQLSVAILKLAESGCLEELSKNLTGSADQCEEAEGYPSQIGITSTLLLFVPLITIHVACIFIHSLKPHRCFWAIGSSLYHALCRRNSLRTSTRYFSSRVGFDASSDDDNHNS